MVVYEEKKKHFNFILCCFSFYNIMVFLGFFGSVRIVRAIFEDINKSENKLLSDFTASILVGSLLDEKFIPSPTDINKLKLNGKHFNDLLKILFIKELLKDYLKEKGELPDALYASIPEAPRDDRGREYYYQKINRNWVMIASVNDVHDLNVMLRKIETQKIILTKNNNLLVIFPIEIPSDGIKH